MNLVISNLPLQSSPFLYPSSGSTVITFLNTFYHHSLDTPMTPSDFSLFNTDKKSLMANDCMNYKCINWSVIKQIFCIFYQLGCLFLLSFYTFSVRAEQLLGMNGNLRQELMLTGELTSELQEGLSQLVQVLIER